MRCPDVSLVHICFDSIPSGRYGLSSNRPGVDACSRGVSGQGGMRRWGMFPAGLVGKDRDFSSFGEREYDSRAELARFSIRKGRPSCLQRVISEMTTTGEDSLFLHDGEWL